MPFRNKEDYNRYMKNYMKNYRKENRTKIKIQTKSRRQARYEKALADYQARSNKNLSIPTADKGLTVCGPEK